MPQIHTAYFRKLPGVDEVLRSPEAQLWMAQSSRAVVTEAVREILATTRQAIMQAADEAALETLPLLLPAVLQQVQARLQAQQTYHLRRLINATGVIVHTNLGRSLLAPAAVANLQEVAESYSNLEYDLERGERGSRYAHVEVALQTLTGAEAALVVNNNAAAVFLALQALATGREVVVSRGQLIERWERRIRRICGTMPRPFPSIRPCCCGCTRVTIASSGSPPRCRRRSWWNSATSTRFQ